MNDERNEIMGRTKLGLLAALVLVVVAATIAAAITLSRDDAPGTDAHAHIEPITTADEVAAAVISGIHTWTPAQQQSPWDAMHAISDQLTGPMAEAAATRPDPDPTPKQWSAWSRSGDRVIGVATVAPNQDPVDEDADRASRLVDVQQRVLHPDGATTPLEQITVAVELERVEQQWKASSYQYRSVGQ